MHDHNKGRTVGKGKAQRFIFRTFAMLAAVMMLTAGAALGSEFSITLNGYELQAEKDFEITAMELFMPLDETLLEALGASLTSVICDGDCFVVRAYGAELDFKAGGSTMLVDNLRDVNIAAVYKDGDTYYVPAAAFFQALDFDAVWHDKEGLLEVGFTVRYPSAQERLADVLGLETPEELERRKKEAAAAADAEYYLDYTYDNTIKTIAARTGGDKSQSRAKEKGDYYNQFNLRQQGFLRNGYNFSSILRTVQTTEPDLKKGELKKLQLSWIKDSKKLTLYDATPKFQTRYIMRSYQLQGINYERETNFFNWQVAAGKIPKSLRRSLYARYVSAARVEKKLPGRRDTFMGASWAVVRDTGAYSGKIKQMNYVTGVDLRTKLGRAVKLSAEAANGYMKNFGGAGDRGNAVLYKMSFAGAEDLSGTASYERTGNNFYSQTSAFTRGRRETVVNLTKKMQSGVVLGMSASDKKIRDRTTKFYPVYLSSRPISGRDSFNLVLKRDFEKTTGGSEKIVEKKAVEIRDMIGNSRVEAKFNRQKNKTPGGNMYFKEQKTFVLKMPLSERLESNISHKRENWKLGRSAVTRQSSVKLNFEPIPWTEITLDLGRYYSTPKNARTTTRIACQKIDIMNDTEWKFEYKFENYRDYNVNSVTLSYSFMR